MNFWDSQFGDKVPDGLKTRVDVSELAGKSTFTYGRYIFNTLGQVTMNVTVLDATEKVIFTKTVPDIQVLINQQVNLVGNVFSKNAGTAITVDTELRPERTINF